ncbi:lipoprotein LpqH [Mycobacterium deserti]|uniref:Lipoprotein LpqH n=1 Tax=Mycobacterium deserti TaxID=2978347 RepID=A0ABT2M812_9MYCO|nr:lipoprotein LpqH [Mycobacterium deserti]MCT7658397.1 lipoprotein LpqH [Mycobacterium deserti]
MKKSVVAAAACIFVVGCSGEPQVEPQPGEVVVDGTTHAADSTKCGQDEWRLRIDTIAGPTESRAYLRLDGETPSVDGVTFSSPEGFNGTAGDGVGSAEVTVAQGIYTISGTAEGFDRAKPTEKRSAKFRIEAPC